MRGEKFQKVQYDLPSIIKHKRVRMQHLFRASAAFAVLKLFLIFYAYILYIWFIVNKVLTKGQFDKRKSS